MIFLNKYLFCQTETCNQRENISQLEKEIKFRTYSVDVRNNS